MRVESQGVQNQRWLSAGAVVGDRSALEGRRRQTRAVTETACRLYSLPADDLRSVTGRHPGEHWQRDPVAVEPLLKNTPFLRKLNDLEIGQLAGYTMQLRLAQPHRTIVRQGINDLYFYILARGTARTQQTDSNGAPGPSRFLTEGESFGECSVLLGEAASFTVETTTPTNWLRIHFRDFALFLEAHPKAIDSLAMSEDLHKRYRSAARLHTWQEEGESILLSVRRHWIVLVRNLLGVFAMLLFLALFNYVIGLLLSPLPSLVSFLAITCFLLPLAIWIILDYANDYHIVTSTRVVHQEKIILVTERRVSAALDRVQNLNLERNFWARLFGYGHLEISTAATIGTIRFDFLPRSPEVLSLISDLSMRAKASAGAENQETIRRQLQDRLHLGLEERIEKRALLEGVHGPVATEQPRTRNPLRRLHGLRQPQDDRLVWRKHWLGLLASTLIPLIGTALALLLMAFVIADINLLNLSPQFGNVVVGLSFLFVLFCMGWLAWEWVDWINDLYILTNQDIEHLEKAPLFFDEKRTVMSLERVQNVSFSKPGPLAYILNFGHVLIQTAAEEGQIVFRYVPQPDYIQAEIFRRIGRYQETQAEFRRKQQKSDMVDWLEAYHQLRADEQSGGRAVA